MSFYLPRLTLFLILGSLLISCGTSKTRDSRQSKEAIVTEWKTELAPPQNKMNTAPPEAKP
jgi:hypothetical protein